LAEFKYVSVEATIKQQLLFETFLVKYRVATALRKISGFVDQVVV